MHFYKVYGLLTVIKSSPAIIRSLLTVLLTLITLLNFVNFC